MGITGEQARELSEYMCMLRRSHVTDVPTNDSLWLGTVISGIKT
jgi:hypothetical protein